MKILKGLIVGGLCVCGLMDVVADDGLKEDSEAVSVVMSFLHRIQDGDPFSYDEEIRFFGEQNILSHVLLLKCGLVDKAGHWLSTNRVSLLGWVLKNNSKLFSVSENATFSSFKDGSQRKVGYVCVTDVCADMKAYFGGGNVCRDIRFCVKFDPTRLDLSNSSICGKGVPFLLGFSSDHQLVETYSGRKKEKWTPIYKGPLPDQLTLSHRL